MSIVAVIGAGPSGLYAAESLAAAGVRVDVIDRLPTPFGLVRYGVAPDHLSIRSVRDTLDRVMGDERVRFLGNVEVGADVTLDDLRASYDAVVLAYGAARDRPIGVPGEDLPGSLAATDVVAWYCGHPDADRGVEPQVSRARRVAVIGVGNVAVDVVRVLAKNAEELSYTDMPQHVLDLLARTEITDIHLFGRRGPVQATFTTKELRELGELSDCDVIVDPADLELDDTSAAALEASRVSARNLDVLREWSTRPLGGHARRLHVHFLAQPVEITGDDRVRGLVVERTEIDSAGGARGTGVREEYDVDLVIRSVGYRGLAMDGVPFDPRRHVIPNDAGRVTDDGAVVPGVYVAGWIKRGPTGIIGTNKKDANETVASILADGLGERSGPDLIDVLSDRGVPVVAYAGWQRIDAAERALGEARGRDRTTIHEREDLLRHATG